MFAKIFPFVIVVAHVTAEISSYFHVCGRKDPNYNQCIAESIKHVKDKVCKGFPEFDIPPNEPYHIDKIVIFDKNNVKLHLINTKVYGFCDFVVNSVHTDPERLHFDIDISFRPLYVKTMYDFDIRLLVPIANKGLVDVTTDNAVMKISLDLKVITKNGKKHIFASKVHSKCDIKSFKYTFDESEKELVQLHTILNEVISNNEMDVLGAVIPAIEERLSRIVLSFFNNVTRSNYEKLFPENT